MAHIDTPKDQLRVTDGVLSVHGALTAQSVVGLLPHGREAISSIGAGKAVLDLAQVTASDSSGWALVVDWLRMARARDVELLVSNVPAQMAALAKVSGLDALLGDGETDGS